MEAGSIDSSDVAKGPEEAPAPSPAPARIPAAFRLMAALPLSLIHLLGGLVGRLAIALVARERLRAEENLRYAGYTDRRMLWAAAGEAGKTLLELPWLWLRSSSEVLARVRDVQGVEHVQAAHAQGRGVIFLTPHIGSFEVAAQYASAHAPITVMYRPPRQRLLQPLAELGRARRNLGLVPATGSGATALLRALRRGEWIGILPDQVPSRGEGEWVEFFGKPAFTMTLALRLQRRTGAPMLLCLCERLAAGRGYRIHVEPLAIPEDSEHPARELNRALENLIRRKPEQYLWSYNRYKVPAGIHPPTGTLP